VDPAETGGIYGHTIMKRALLLAVGVVVAGALLLPTVASPFASSSGVDRVTPIEMAPSESPNGVYAQIGDDGNISLVIDEHTQAAAQSEGGDGVNSDGVTHIDNIFTIAYNGSEDIKWDVWLELDGTDAQFYRGSDPTRSLEGQANSVVLGPDETLSVGLRIDTTGEHAVETIDEFTVRAEGETGDSADAEDDNGDGSDEGDSGGGDNSDSDDDKERDDGGDDEHGDAGGDGDSSEGGDGDDGETGPVEDNGTTGSQGTTDDSAANGDEMTPAGDAGAGLEDTLVGSLSYIWLLLLLLVLLSIMGTSLIRWALRPG